MSYWMILALSTVEATAGFTRVPRWEPADFAFRCEARPANPFQTAFSATVQGPGGAQLTVPGFYDGAGVWKVRVAPTAEGEWTLRTRSDIPELNGHHVSFRCVPNANPRIHGGLRIDPDHPRHFRFEDGTRCFPMGYECDWLWALDADDPSLPTVNRFLDRIAAHGFNCVLLNAYALDTRWREGRTGPDDYGPPPRYAWAGTNEEPDHSRFNLDYWRHYDRVIDALYRRGILAHVMIKVYNKRVHWPERGSAEDATNTDLGGWRIRPTAARSLPRRCAAARGRSAWRAATSPTTTPTPPGT